MRSPTVTDRIAYIRRVFAPENATAQACRSWAETVHAGGISLGAEEGAYLHFFACLIGATKILEIGTLGGYSALYLARALPPSGRLFSLEKRPDYVETARRFLNQAGYGDRVKILCGEALDLLPLLESEAPFDLVFIDADKRSYLDYLDWSEKFLRPGGLLIADNTLLFGTLPGRERHPSASLETGEMMRLFNERLARGDVFSSILLPTPDGLLVARKLSVSAGAALVGPEEG